MTVYLIHLDRPLGGVQSPEAREARGLPPRQTDKPKYSSHYIGYTDNLPARLLEHRKGNSSRFIHAAHEAGIPWRLARLFPGKDRNYERQLKRQHNTRQYCPICQTAAGRKPRISPQEAPGSPESEQPILNDPWPENNAVEARTMDASPMDANPMDDIPF